MDFEPIQVYRCWQVVPQEGTMDAIVVHVRRRVDQEKQAHRATIAALEGLELVLRPVIDSHQLTFEVTLHDKIGRVVHKKTHSLRRSCALAVCAYRRMCGLKRSSRVKDLTACSVRVFMPSPYSETAYDLPEQFWQAYIP